MVLGFGGPTKGIMIIWVHFVILVGCELVTFKPQIMLSSISKILTSKIFIMVFGDMLLLSILSFSNRMLFSNAQAKLAAAKSLKVTFATRKEQKN